MLIYGHRGARGEAPENTLAGFHRAISAGVAHVELDLRLSRDSQLVVIHDDTVNRTTNGRGTVAHLTVQELARLDARRGAPDCATPQPVPTIVRVLEEFPQMLHFQLEAKPVSATQRALMAERLAQLFAEFQLYQRATVTSFDVHLLRELGASDARVPRGLVSDRTRPDPLKLALELEVELLVLNWKLCTAERIAAAHASGIRVSAWTVNDEKVARRLHSHGIDSIVTDYPTHMMALSLSLQGAQPDD